MTYYDFFAFIYFIKNKYISKWSVISTHTFL